MSGNMEQSSDKKLVFTFTNEKGENFEFEIIIEKVPLVKTISKILTPFDTVSSCPYLPLTSDSSDLSD